MATLLVCGRVFGTKSDFAGSEGISSQALLRDDDYDLLRENQEIGKTSIMGYGKVVGVLEAHVGYRVLIPRLHRWCFDVGEWLAIRLDCEPCELVSGRESSFQFERNNLLILCRWTRGIGQL